MMPALAVIAGTMLLAAGTPTKIGDWEVWKVEGLQVASTTNAAGAILGLMCNSGRCTAFLVTGNGCTEGSKASMLLSSAIGAAPISTACRHLAGAGSEAVRPMSVVEESAVVQKAIEAGGVIGVAIPMENGAFRVLRFSTGGATLAIRDAMTAPDRRQRGEGPAPASEYQ